VIKAKDARSHGASTDEARESIGSRAWSEDRYMFYKTQHWREGNAEQAMKQEEE
jgi:hypothetical protein